MENNVALHSINWVLNWREVLVRLLWTFIMILVLLI